MLALGGIAIWAWPSDDGQDPESVERQLLDRAISALWGNVDPASIHSLRTRSTVTGNIPDLTPGLQVETYCDEEDRYREVRDYDASGIKEIFAVFGEDCWASVDSTVIPLEPSEIQEHRLQPWLFRISKLVALRDAERFELEHLGLETLATGEVVERLQVTPKDKPLLELVFDFMKDSHLLRRVKLINRNSDEELMLVLDDYRAVEGIQFAHRRVAHRDGKKLARQIVETVELNPVMDKSLFRTPLDLNRDAIIEKKSLAGFFAFAEHRGDPEDLGETVDELKEWIQNNPLDMIGPLTVLNAENDGGDEEPRTTPMTVCIGIRRPDAGQSTTARKGFGVRQLDSHRALCMTHVGETKTALLVERLRVRAKELGLQPAGPTLEIRFSLDGKTRQIQLPVK